MANTQSALKRHRQNLRRRERNRGRRTEARSAVRAAREAIASGNRDEADAAIRQASAILDRVAQKGTLHPNNAARRKSRLMRALHRAEAPVEEAPKRRRATKAAPARKTRAKKS